MPDRMRQMFWNNDQAGGNTPMRFHVCPPGDKSHARESPEQRTARNLSSSGGNAIRERSFPAAVTARARLGRSAIKIEIDVNSSVCCRKKAFSRQSRFRLQKG